MKFKTDFTFRLLTILFSVLLIITLQVNPSKAQSFSANVKVNHITDEEQTTDGGKALAVHGNNVYVLWWSKSGDFISYVSKSEDGGATFSDGVPVSAVGPQIFGSIAVDNAGTIYAAWDRLTDSGEMPEGVYFAKSTDDAKTFSTPVTISLTGLLPQIAVYDNYVYLFFLMNKGENGIGYFFSRSTDGGLTFAQPYEITDATFDLIKFDAPSHIYVDNLGAVYCVWNDSRQEGDGTSIYYAKSTDNGASFGANIAVNNTNVNPDKIRTGAKIAADDSNVYVTWRQDDDENGNNRKILFAKSIDGGITFVGETELASGGWGSPYLAINSNNNVYIAFPQYSAEQNGIFCTKSIDQGDSFPVTVFISDQNQDARNITLCVDESDMVYCVWEDNRSDDGDVFFSKGTITITDLKEEESVILDHYELSQNYPNPFNPATTIKYSLQSASYVSLKVYDTLGKEVATLVNEMKSKGYYEVKFDGSKLASGVYIYRLNAGTFSAVKKLLLMK